MHVGHCAPFNIYRCPHDKCTVLSATFDKLGEILTWDIYGLRFSISHLRRWLYYADIYIYRTVKRKIAKQVINYHYFNSKVLLKLYQNLCDQVRSCIYIYIYIYICIYIYISFSHLIPCSNLLGCYLPLGTSYLRCVGGSLWAFDNLFII